MSIPRASRYPGQSRQLRQGQPPSAVQLSAARQHGDPRIADGGCPYVILLLRDSSENPSCLLLHLCSMNLENFFIEPVSSHQLLGASLPQQSLPGEPVRPATPVSADP